MKDLEITNCEFRTKLSYGKWSTIYAGNMGDAEQMVHNILTAFEANIDCQYMKEQLTNHHDFCRFAASLVNDEGIA